MHKQGRKTHRDIVREDIEYCLQYADEPDKFIMQLKGLGYEFDRTRMSVQAKGWQRAVRLSTLGFDTNFINACLEKNYNDEDFWLKWNAHLPYKPKRFPLESELRKLAFSVEHAYKTETILVDTILYLFFTVIKIALETADCLLLSPDIRAAARDVERYISYHHFLTDNNIHTRQELLEQIRSAEIELKALEDRRNKTSNKLRRATNNTLIHEYKELRKDISRQIKPIRERLRKLLTIDEKAAFAYGLLQTEYRLEVKALMRRQRNR